MAQDPLEMFSPKNPHRRLHILVSILAFMAVIGSMAIYQISRINEEIMLPVTEGDSNGLSMAQRTQIVANLEEESAKSPPLTEIQRNEIINNLKKSADKNK